MIDWHLQKGFIAGSSTSHQANVVHDMEYQAMDFELLPPSFPLPLSTPPPPSSFSEPPPQSTLAGRPKRNYRVPARYEDVNPEPLRPLEEEDEQPTAELR